MTDSDDTRSHSNNNPKHIFSGLQIVFLILGAALIIGATVFTSTRLNDRTVFTVLVPSVVVGLGLIALGVLGRGNRHSGTGGSDYF
jgi:hypothetical protein